MKLRYPAAASAFVLFFLFAVPIQSQIRIGKKKTVTDKNSEAANELGVNRNTDPLVLNKELTAKVHTVAILTVAGAPKIDVGVKSADVTPVLARAETLLVTALNAAGYAVQPLDKTRELVKQQWAAAYVDAMPESEREKLLNLSEEEKESYVKNNLFAKLNQKMGGGNAEEGEGGKWCKSSPNTFYLTGMLPDWHVELSVRSSPARYDRGRRAST